MESSAGVSPSDAVNDSSTSILIIIGADSVLKKRIGAEVFSFTVRFLEEPPREKRLGIALMLPFSPAANFASRIPRYIPFIGYGPGSELVEAFSLGAMDYLKEPWDIEEFRLRVERVLGIDVVRIPGIDISLTGPLLRGSCGIVYLSQEESTLLRELILAAPKRLSRAALRRYIWPSLSDSTRVVDVSISRLRCHLDRVSGEQKCVQIRSVRGFGYSLIVVHAL